MPRRTFPQDLNELGLELRDLSHQEASNRFPAYLLNDLPLQEQAELVKHVRGCQSCFDKIEALEMALEAELQERKESR